MKCIGCGAEIKDSKFCSVCGAKQDNCTQKQSELIINQNQPINQVNTVQRKMKKHGCLITFIVAIVIIILLFVFICFIGSSSEEENKETIEKLNAIAQVTHSNDKYLFSLASDTGNKPEKWEFGCTKENLYINMYDAELRNDLNSIFGENALCDGRITYILPKNQIAFFLDSDVTDGTDIVYYDLDKEEYTVMYHGERYEIADEFKKALEDENVLERSQEDLAHVENMLKKQDITMDMLECITYEDCDNALKIESSPDEEGKVGTQSKESQSNTATFEETETITDTVMEDENSSTKEFNRDDYKWISYEDLARNPEQHRG